MNRRAFLRAGTAATLAGTMRAQAPDLEEITIDELARNSATSATEQYLARIRELDSKVHSVIEINPDALSIAKDLDGGPKRGPLHGIPVLIKDNIDTADRMKTTAGSLALVNAKPPRDAAVVERLRAAGAVILGKTNLSEWANFRSSHSVSGWSARG